MSLSSDPAIESVLAAAYEIPTDKPESDGTLAWDSTTMVTVEITAGGVSGFGYTYGDAAVAKLVDDVLAPVLADRDALATRTCWSAMIEAIRNLGRPGLSSMAVAACDVALHDLLGKLLDAPVARLLGLCRDAVPIYGSGGFTSYDDTRLSEQLGAWAAAGIGAVKMKVGREPAEDPRRVRIARAAIGDEVGLFVDANGAYSRRQATGMAERFAEFDVTWFEEPVSSDDLEGLRYLRDHTPASMEITAGEYGFDLIYFRRMMEAGAVDVIQIDATRCAGYTGFMMADALARAHGLETSSHTAPALHLPCACAALRLRHIEWFHDHVRIERLLLDGAPDPTHGRVRPDLSRPGIGVAFRHVDAEPYRV